jgi:hypothetical protein
MGMKNLTSSLIFLLLLITFANSRLNAQVELQSIATGMVSVEIITSFSALETSKINFGHFSAGPSGGQIILTPQGYVSVIGSVVLNNGVQNPGSFFISGGSQSTFSINLPDKPAMLTNQSNNKTIGVRNWSYISSVEKGEGTLQGGFQTVFVGVTLDVGPMKDNPGGLYTGFYSITFDFN